MASTTSAMVPAVRTKLVVELQQALAAKSDVIMDGRDIGTVVIPHAQVKYLSDRQQYGESKRRYGTSLTAKGESS